jgi:predicted nucleotidyltransferase component of viral defense system
MEFKGKYMSTLRSILESQQRLTGSSWNLIEQDYALSLILHGISQIDELKKHLVFKGGTCLRKYYFGDYRFSQDADFSVQGEYPKGDLLQTLLNQACTVAADYLVQKNINAYFECIRYVEKSPHPTNQEAFTIAIQYPWHRQLLTRVMVEVTSAERVVLEPIEKSIIHGYEPNFNADLLIYPLEEMMAEKIRALIQFHKKLHERGWGRSRARDYYDLWRVFQLYHNCIDFPLIDKVVREKCLNKELVFEGYHQIFSDGLMSDLDDSWDRWVRPLVPGDLSKISIVIGDLKAYLLVV